MKKVIYLAVALILLSFVLSSCGTKSAKIQSLDADDISYFQDKDTGLCFAAIGSRQGSDISGGGTGMGFTCVPCDSLTKVRIKNFD